MPVLQGQGDLLPPDSVAVPISMIKIRIDMIVNALIYMRDIDSNALIT